MYKAPTSLYIYPFRKTIKGTAKDTILIKIPCTYKRILSDFFNSYQNLL